MKSAWKIGTLGFMYAYFVACSPVKFAESPAPECGAEGVACVSKCEGENCFEVYTAEKTVGKQPVDILIVNDNSGSMSFEQKKMGDAFKSFLTGLGQVDYRIAMTTTDISYAYSKSIDSNGPGPNNGYGALQDGKLIEFESGRKFLTNSVSNRDALFRSTISRKETKDCEDSGYKNCPSSDERGVFAASLAVERNEFLRPGAHLAVIILSDEDERGMSDSRSALNQSDRSTMALYPLEDRDKPANFVSLVQNRHPGKSLSVHSIIVKPTDTTCRDRQSSQGNFIRGVEGYTYAALTNLTGGIMGTICADQYDTQLADIGKDIQDKSLTLPFVCRPANDDYVVKFTPNVSSTQVSVTPNWDKKELVVEGNIPGDTKVTLTYKCAK